MISREERHAYVRGALDVCQDLKLSTEVVVMVCQELRITSEELMEFKKEVAKHGPADNKLP